MHKKPKKMKRMMDGGMAGTQAAMSRRPNPMSMQPTAAPAMQAGNPMRRLAEKAFKMGGGRLSDGFKGFANQGYGIGRGDDRRYPIKEERGMNMPVKTPPRMQRDIGFGNGVPYPPGFVPGKGPYPAMGQPPKTKTLVNPEAMQGLGGLEGGTSGTQGIGGAVGGALMGQQAAAQQSGLRSLTPQEAAQYGIQMNAQQANSGASPGMRGGGLARKGVGQALAKGGLVKANGCAQRGKTKGKIV